MVGDLVRVLAAGVRARARIDVSSAVPLPSGVLALVAPPSMLQDAVLNIRSITIESDEVWQKRALSVKPARVRLVGGDASALAVALGGTPDVAIWGGPVTAAGRVELLPFLREQAISVTAHRFGNPDRGMIGLPI